MARHTPEKRIRLALTELGPTFIKLGQLLSTRPDLAGVQLADELKQLQADVPADPPDLVCSLVEEELGQPVAELFAEFDDVPIASASIGQVHAARLVTGEDVVVKVQHAGIEETVREDLDVLTDWPCWPSESPNWPPIAPRRRSPKWAASYGGNWTLAARNGTSSSSAHATKTIRPSTFRNRSPKTAPPAC